jgi:hypothetical protein
MNENASNFCATVTELEGKNLPSYNQRHWSPLKKYNFFTILSKSGYQQVCLNPKMVNCNQNTMTMYSVITGI